MFFYDMGQRGACSLYEYLYRCIRHDIAHGAIAAGEKLPSKRNLAKHLGISLITVEAAYQQLAAEGYIRSRERCGYYACDLAPAEQVWDEGSEGFTPTLDSRVSNADSASRKTSDDNVPRMPAQSSTHSRNHDPNESLVALGASPARVKHASSNRSASPSPSPACDTVTPCAADTGSAASSAAGAPITAASTTSPLLADFTHSTLATELFPYTTWAKNVRRTLSDETAASLAEASSAAGSPQLRQAIADHLHEFRGMQVHAEQIVIGAGSQTLYQLIVQLLGRNRTFAVETPGYPLLTRMYEQQNVHIERIPLDANGIAMESLRQSGASVAHLMPSHQFPTGIVTSASRRRELLNWTREGDRYLIEDDYDAEFRMAGRPIPPLFSIDAAERVLYLNSFAKSLGAAFRMAYLVLPPRLAQQFHDQLGFYANTVSPLDQLALAHFIESGSYERHVNRLRTRARKTQDALVSALRERFGNSISFSELSNGLHFIMHFESNRSEADLIAAALNHGVRIAALSAFEGDRKSASGLEQALPHDMVTKQATPTANSSIHRPQFILRSDAIDAESASIVATALASAWE